MQEYIDNGARLGWLLDPSRRQVHIYQQETRVQLLDDPPHLSGEPVLHGFALDVGRIWAAIARKNRPRAG